MGDNKNNNDGDLPTLTEPEFLGVALQKAREGDPDAARILLDKFCAVYNSRPATVIDPIWPAPVMEYLSRAFSEYLGGEKDIVDAMLLNAPRGRPQGTRASNGLSLVAKMHLRMRAGATRSDALFAVCEKFGVTDRTMERYEQTFAFIKELPDDADNCLLRSLASIPVRPQPKA